MEENFTSLTPRGRALLISNRARKNHNKSHKDTEPSGEARKLLFALLGPPWIPRDIGMPPDDLQLETMDEIRELIQYPVKASSEDDGEEDEKDGMTPSRTSMELMQRFDYLNEKEVWLRLKARRNPHVRHLITFDFLARYGYMTPEEVVLRFSALSAADKAFIDSSPNLLEDKEYMKRHPGGCNCSNARDDEPCADKILHKALWQMLEMEVWYSLSYIFDHFFSRHNRRVHPSIVQEVFARGDDRTMSQFFSYSSVA
eukprot:6144537-Pleurochrysis_carterae.AAC.1